MILLTSHSLIAQSKIGITGGGTFATVTAKFQGISLSPKMKAGFTVGIFSDVPLSPNFSFQPALNFVQKGYSSEDDTYSDKININYLEVPFNFVYSVKNNAGFFIGAGPSIAFGISGKEKYTDKIVRPNSEDTKIKFGSSDDQMKRTDVGVNFLSGYKFAGGFLIAVNYNLGLTNVQNGDASQDGTIKNRYFAIKLGCILGRKDHK
jgi:hypothetical protein